MKKFESQMTEGFKWGEDGGLSYPGRPEVSDGAPSAQVDSYPRM